jgi:acyl-CoA thioesterase
VVSPDEVAEQSVATMWADDTASRAMGMEVISVAPGNVVVQMAVRPDMVNGHGSCHGGVIASLADSAFAFSCNTYGEVNVAAQFEIDFLEAVRLGGHLVATATERARRGRSGIYDVTVRRGEEVVAEFRGRSRSLGRPITPAG